MLGQQSRPSSFRHGNIDQRHNRATKVENAQHVSRGERQLRHQRPLQNFFHIQHREAEPFAPAAEYAVLRFRRTFAKRP